MCEFYKVAETKILTDIKSTFLEFYAFVYIKYKTLYTYNKASKSKYISINKQETINTHKLILHIFNSLKFDA